MYQRDIALSYLFDIALISLKCDIYSIVIFMKCTTYVLLQKGMTFFSMLKECHFNVTNFMKLILKVTELQPK